MSEKYQHREAFCLMLYRSDDGLDEETLWNSRDGVTPFMITTPNGKPMAHIEWNRDICIPDFVPTPGMRIFVDATLDLVTPELKKYVERIFSEHAGGYWDTPEEAFNALLPDWLREGSPWIVTVKFDALPEARERHHE